MTSRKQVITRLCCKSAHVASEVFQYQHPADCFCGKNDLPSLVDVNTYQYSEEVMRFIEDAIDEKIRNLNLGADI